MRRADRLFQLVQLLRVRRFATADQLAEELGVSKRTVYRDIRDLELSGVPIVGEAGVGYHLQRGYELPPLTFTSDEIEALVIGARVVQSWGDPELAAAARAALTRVEAVLPAPLAEALRSTALFAPTGRKRGADGPVLSLARRALADHRKLTFAYTRADGEASARTVRPVGLYYWGLNWSLAAWCELREDYRNFRLDRMRDVELRDETFDASGDISLPAFLAHMQRQLAAIGVKSPM